MLLIYFWVPFFSEKNTIFLLFSKNRETYRCNFWHITSHQNWFKSFQIFHFNILGKLSIIRCDKYLLLNFFVWLSLFCNNRKRLFTTESMATFKRSEASLHSKLWIDTRTDYVNWKIDAIWCKKCFFIFITVANIPTPKHLWQIKIVELLC